MPDGVDQLNPGAIGASNEGRLDRQGTVTFLEEIVKCLRSATPGSADLWTGLGDQGAKKRPEGRRNLQQVL